MTVTFQLRPQYVGVYGGGTISVGNTATAFNVGAALTAGGGSIVTTSQELVNELMRYPPVFPAADDGQPLVPQIDMRLRAFSVGNGATGTETIIEARRNGDAFPRWSVDAAGSMFQGSGAVAPSPFTGGGGGGGSPSGAAGGVLGGSYPNPGFAADMATQAELNSAVTTLEGLIATSGGGSPVLLSPSGHYWQMGADDTGHVTLTDLGLTPGGAGGGSSPILLSPNSHRWQLGADDGGHVTLTDLGL